MDRYTSSKRWKPLYEWFETNVSGDPHVTGPTNDVATNLTIGVLDTLDAAEDHWNKGEAK